MRIVIDLQGAQSTQSRHTDVGSYSLLLTQAVARQRGEHEIVIALSDAFPETVEGLRGAFDGLLPEGQVRVWQAPGRVGYNESGNRPRRRIAELVREAFLASLRPDMVLVTSLFEGLADDSVTSIGRLPHGPATAVIVHDPPSTGDGIAGSPSSLVESWHLDKLDHLRRAQLVLSTSEPSASLLRNRLGLGSDDCLSVSGASDPRFHPQPQAGQYAAGILRRHGLIRPFVMATTALAQVDEIEALIRAYALLPDELRARHQLAIVGSTPPDIRARLLRCGVDNALPDGELVVTARVFDSDLPMLYGLCRLFVALPHAGSFALPALQAFRSGRAVVGADDPGVAELIARRDVLFDKHDERSMADTVGRVLADPGLRLDLERHGLARAASHSWERSARLVLHALQHRHGRTRRMQVSARHTEPVPRRRLAHVSALPPEPGIASDLVAFLLPELARHYDIDVVVAQAQVSAPAIEACCTIRSVDWFRQHALEFDRVLYHVGSSPSLRHVIDLLEDIPGVVVLHDFFLGSLIGHLDQIGAKPNFWAQCLYLSHGYGAARELHAIEHPQNLVTKYPVNAIAVGPAIGSLSHSQSTAGQLRHWLGPAAAEQHTTIPAPKAPARPMQRHHARRRLGLAAEAFVICSFGPVDPTRATHRIADSWLRSSLSKHRDCQLVFVGANDPGAYGDELLARIANADAAGGISIAGACKPDLLQTWLSAADACVQLHAPAHDEASPEILDCLDHGLATIVDDSASGLPAEAVLRLRPAFEDDDIVAALETLFSKPTLRRQLSDRARAHVRGRHHPRAVAQHWFDAIEAHYDGAPGSTLRLAHSLSREIHPSGAAATDLADVASHVARNTPSRQRLPQVFVDISVLAGTDARTGIQRVVRSILAQWLTEGVPGYRVEPVYSQGDGGGYRYARSFTCRFLGMPDLGLADDVVDYGHPDAFIALDLAHHALVVEQPFLQTMRRRGVRVYSVVYDLLPIKWPEAFPANVETLHQRWLDAVVQMDGAVCASRTVAGELLQWCEVNGPARTRPFRVHWFPLGADIEASMPSSGRPAASESVLNAAKSTPTFLMVGTIEPRKRHAQALAAFDLLWAGGADVALVVAGKPGWHVDAFMQALAQHPENGRRLVWLDAPSDEFLAQLYGVCACLLAASQDEGFGLPIVEAARASLPVLARDIPIFREVGGDEISYFTGDDPESLAAAIQAWLGLRSHGALPVVSRIRQLTWRQSGDILAQAITGGEPHAVWVPDGVHRFGAANSRLRSQVGQRVGQEIVCRGEAGYLLYGPYIDLAPGRYRARIQGALAGAVPDGVLADVACEQGTSVLARAPGTDWRPDGPWLVSIDFELDTPCRNLEVRLWVVAGSSMTVHMLEIAAIDRA